MAHTEADIVSLANEMQNNHAKFTSFGWLTRPEDSHLWAIIYTAGRDSDALERANALIFTEALEPFREEDCAGNDCGDARPEHHGHWACGYVDGWAIRVRNSDGRVTEAFRAFAELELSRREYPCLDDDLCSQLETEEANDIWRDCYNARERIAYIRRNRSQFEFRDLADMIACVRGRYFAGSASELCAR